MRKSILLVVFVLVIAFTAIAQEAPKAEVFGGYQYTNVDTKDLTGKRINLNGWNAQVNGYFTKNFGISADFSGAYGSPEFTEGDITAKIDTKIYSYMFGPVFRFPMEKVTPFAHALFGGAHANFSAMGESVTSNGFAYALGGGFDVNTGKHVAVRVGQFDFLGTRFESTNQSNFRYSAGVVFKF